MVSVTSLALHLRMFPFVKADDNHDQAIVLSVIFFSLFSGLLLKTDTTGEDSYEMSIFSTLLTVANVTAIAVPPIHLAVGLYQKHGKKPSAAARISPAEPEEVEVTPRDRQPADMSTIIDCVHDDGCVSSNASSDSTVVTEGLELQESAGF